METRTRLVALGDGNGTWLVALAGFDLFFGSASRSNSVVKV